MRPGGELRVFLAAGEGRAVHRYAAGAAGAVPDAGAADAQHVAEEMNAGIRQKGQNRARKFCCFEQKILKIPLDTKGDLLYDTN